MTSFSLCLFMILFNYSTVLEASSQDMHTIARQTLEKNIVDLPSGSYVSAGGLHFGSLWTRDFAWAVGGLLAIDKQHVVKNHIQVLLNNTNENNLIPRVLDSSPSWARVFMGILKRPISKLRDPLRPEFKGEHGTVAIDSNLLILRSSILYFKATQDHSFWQENEVNWTKLLKYYDPVQWQGWIVQENYGDWQDSVKRKGVSFLTNYLWWEVRDELLSLYSEEQTNKLFGFDQADQDVLLSKLWQSFFDENFGLFKSHLSTSVISLDGNLLALLNENFIEQSQKLNLTTKRGETAQEIYLNLKRSPLWSGQPLPGRASWPNYPASWRSFATRAVGLHHYHDAMVWSWLTGFSLKLAHKMGDEQEVSRILRILDQTVKRDQGITEIWRPNASLDAFKSLFYRSENPFSWGAGVILEALASIEKRQIPKRP